MRGVKWDHKVDDILRERYANTSNKVLSKELGYALRTIERHARELGLRKSDEFIRETQMRASMEGARYFEYMRLTGQKIKKQKNSGRMFEKGHKFTGEIEAKRIKALQDRAWEERKRIIHGLCQKTKWRMNTKAYEK